MGSLLSQPRARDKQRATKQNCDFTSSSFRKMGVVVSLIELFVKDVGGGDGTNVCRGSCGDSGLRLD